MPWEAYGLMKSQSNLRIAFFAWVALAAGMVDLAAQGGTFRLSSRSYSVKESSPVAKITVSRSGGSSGTVTVGFQTVDQAGSEASPGVDYASTNGVLTFPPGVTSKSFDVPIFQDAVHETNQTLTVELTGVEGEGAVLDGNYFSARITITDDDPCVYAINPTTRTFRSDEAGPFSFEASATEACPTTPVSDAIWLGVIDYSEGVVHCSLDFNTGSTERTGKIRFGNKTFTVTQKAPDEAIPVVTFSTPAAGSRQTNRTITVTGKASDNGAVTLVEYRLENTNSPPGDFFPAEGLASWTAVVSNLVPGTNVIRVRAHDSAQLISDEVTLSVLFVEVSPLTLSTNGIGAISPYKNGQYLDVGKEYTISARPGRKYFFSGWTGGIESAANPLPFTMEPALSLQANFVLSPYIGLAGTYNGLFREESVTRHESSGFLSAKVSDVGAFSAKMVLGGRRVSFSGQLSLDGTTTNHLDREDIGQVTVVLGFYDLVGGSDLLTGVVSNADWSASLTAVRAFSSYDLDAVPATGRYTLLMPGDDENAAAEPGGDSYGSVSVDTRGGAKFQLVLADGTTATQKVPLGTNGWCPIYVPLYAKGGSIQGWTFFGDALDSDLAGTFAWIKPTLATAKYYSNGFALAKEFTGARYRPSTNELDRLLPFSSGKVEFSAGNLAAPFENLVGVSSSGTVSNKGDYRMTFTLSRSTGLFRGTVTPPEAARSVPFKGAVHRRLGIGSGYFLGTNQSGRVLLSE